MSDVTMWWVEAHVIPIGRVVLSTPRGGPRETLCFVLQMSISRCDLKSYAKFETI